MKILRVIFIVLWVLGGVGIAVALIDLITGATPDPIGVHIVLLTVGWAGHYWVNKKLSK